MGLFLDFDGVLCDSLNECFVSSWIAFYRRYRGETPTSVTLRDYRLFRQYRPFIRRGEDYLLLQALIRDGVAVPDQRAFDAAVERAGWEHMATYRALLYSVRESFLRSDMAGWLALHQPYDRIVDALMPLALDDDVWIISTKRPEFVQHILSGWGVKWSLDRITMPVSRTKIQVIQSIMERTGIEEAVFVDDQIDHLRCDDAPEIRCCLALWGHVVGDEPEPDNIEPMKLEEFLELLDERATRRSRRSGTENGTHPG
jgi:phosphoglycolate phosphatase-like HAD superfamily hydrolase